MSGAGWTQIAIAVGLIGGLLLALELGHRLGRRHRDRGDDPAPQQQLETIQAAVLGLLGLLLGFSFAGAAERFVDRQDLIVREANAIHTAYLGADLLAEPYRSELRKLLREYTASRIAWLEELSGGRDRAQAAAEALQPRIWSAAVQGARRSPQLGATVLPAVIELINLHTARTAAVYRHLPALVVAALVASAIVGLGTVGYGCALAGRRYLMLSYALGFLVVTTLWVILDLDSPRLFLIRTNQEPLLVLQRSLMR